ncbi:unnamed protein product [Trichobilharzia szidati]|nr:unnamed protein product [Trichobilharzia szidati]
MKPNEMELRLLNEIINLHDKLQNARIKSHEVSLLRQAVEANLQQITNLPMLTVVHNLKAHTNRVHDIVWVPNDRYVLTVGSEGCIVIWDPKVGLIHNVYDASKIQPITVAATNDAQSLFCGGLCATVVLANKIEQPPEDGYSYYDSKSVYEHSGQINCILCMNDTHLLTCSVGDGALIWDIERVKVIGRYSHRTAQVTTACFLHDDSSTFLTADEEGVIHHWDIRKSDNSVLCFEGHQADVNCIKSLPNGYNFVTGSEDTFIHLYDIRTDIIIAKYRDKQARPITSSGDNEVTMVSSGLQPTTLAYAASPMTQATSFMNYSDSNQRQYIPAVNDLAVSSSGRLVISGCNDWNIYYWDLSRSDKCVRYDTEIGPVMKVAMSNKRNALAMMTWDPKVKINIMRPR